jgi:exodeoxyribonuclease V gamma subunit
LPVGDFVLSGNFSRATPEGLLFYRPATIKPKDLLRAWVEHLLYHTVCSDGEPAQTVIVGTESIWKFAPVPDPQPALEKLLESYWAGLCQPLKFFPESSYAFAAADYKELTGTKGRTVKTPIDFAQDKWNGNDFGTAGECEDEYFALFFKTGDPLDGDFETYARVVFHPLLQVSEEVKE